MAIKRETLSNQILLEVISILKQNQYKSGDLIPTEKDISERLGVSRNSVRETMKTLNIAHITESIPGKGTILKVNAEDINGDSNAIFRHIMGASFIDIMYVRKALECEAAVLAAGRASTDPQGVARMVRAKDELIDALSTGKFDMSQEGQAFHMAIASLSGNSLLYDLLNSIRKEYKDAISLLHLGTRYHSVENNIHSAICDAIEKGDAESARRSMENHYDRSIANYLEQLGESSKDSVID